MLPEIVVRGTLTPVATVLTPGNITVLTPGNTVLTPGNIAAHPSAAAAVLLPVA